MKWLLILFLFSPDGTIVDAKFFPDLSQEECMANGKAAQNYFHDQGQDVRFKCVTDI